MGNLELNKKIRELLHLREIPYREVNHEPSSDCMTSATSRGEDLKIGGKTILFKGKNGFSLFVLSAALSVDSNQVRKILKSQKLRFATESELMKEVGVSKGALPPFGRDILPYDLYLDDSILENQYIAFNAAFLTQSFIFKVSDYLKVVTPKKICSFSKR